MRVRVNGSEADLDPTMTIDDLVSSLGIERRGVAVSVDREVVPRSRWATTRVTEGASIEVLAAAAGG